MTKDVYNKFHDSKQANKLFLSLQIPLYVVIKSSLDLDFYFNGNYIHLKEVHSAIWRC